MLERDIERYLCDEVKKLGGIAYKFTSPGHRSVPDRVCALPWGVVYFVECKRPGKKPTQLQQREMDRLNQLGCRTRFVDSKPAVDALILEMKTEVHLWEEFFKGDENDDSTTA